MASRAARRFFLWALPALLGISTAGLLTAGFAAGLSGRLGKPVSEEPLPVATPIPATTGNELRIVALGDSLTRGAGDANGGYPRRVADALRKGSRRVTLENFGVDGLESLGLIKKLEAPSVRAALASAHLILFSIGGNDLTHGVSIGPSALGGGDPTARTLAVTTKNLSDVFQAIRAANPNAPIRVLGLYNPFPPGGGEPERRMMREALLRWNDAISEATFAVSGAVAVPTFDLFEERADRLSPDRFHPGPAGYTEIAQRILSTLPASLSSPSAESSAASR